MMLMSSSSMATTDALLLNVEREVALILRPPCTLEDGSTETRRERRRPSIIPIERLDHHVIRSLSGDSAPSSLSSLSLSISSSSSNENLRLLATSFPFLESLSLDNSHLVTLRILGTNFDVLQSLSVCHCGLQSLSGIVSVPSLKVLKAHHNHIDNLLPLTHMRKITHVDLGSNDIENFDCVSFLMLCPSLTHLTLRGNVIADDNEYRRRIFNMIPKLKMLDNQPNYHHSLNEHCPHDDHSDDDDHDDNNQSQMRCSTNECNQDSIEPHLQDSQRKEVRVKERRLSTATREIIDKLIFKLDNHSKKDDESKEKTLNEAKKEEMVKSDAECDNETPTETLESDHEGNTEGNMATTRSAINDSDRLLRHRASLTPTLLPDLGLDSEKPNLTRLLGSSGATPTRRADSTSSSLSESESSSVTISIPSRSSDSGVDCVKDSSVRLPRLRPPMMASTSNDDQSNQLKHDKNVHLARDNSGLVGLKSWKEDIEIEDYEDNHPK